VTTTGTPASTSLSSRPTADADAANARGTLLVAYRVVTLGHGRYQARCVLVRGRRVVWVGDDPALAPPHASVLDLAGCSLGPGFVDAHVHLTPTGITLGGLDVRDVGSGEQLLAAVRTYAEQHPGRVVWGHGWDEHAIEGDLPDPAALSTATGGRPLYLSRVDGHSCLVDEATLGSAPLARVQGIERDAEGRPTGVLKLEADRIARRWAVGAMSEADLEAARQRVARRAASLGIVSVHEMNGPDLMGATDFDAWRFGTYPVEVVPYWGGLDLGFVAERDLKHVGGDLYLDGTIGSRTAALEAPYADADTTGHLEFDDDTLTELFVEATHAGIQVAVHAIGDAALRQLVRCWQQVEAGLPDYLEGAVRRLHHRVEHAEVVPPDLYDDIAALGLVVSSQPAFESTWGGPGGVYETRLGPERARWTNPLRALADRGVGLALGSDANVTPLDPWGAIHAAQHRRDPAHAIDRLEAVSSHTLGGRNAARQEHYVGVVRAGMRADLAVFEGDPYAADDPRGARCVLTVLGGRVTHGLEVAPGTPLAHLVDDA
jgi:predicted amidohydrolase YtcJ